MVSYVNMDFSPCSEGKLRGSRRAAPSLRRQLAAAGIAALSGVLTTAGPVAAQTLTAAFAEAYRTNPQLLAQRALLRATDEQVPQALANWRPTVAFTAQTGHAGGGVPVRTR